MCDIMRKALDCPFKTPSPYLSYSLIPGTNHLTGSNFKLEGLSSVPGGVELLPICQRACTKERRKKTH